MPDTPNHPTHRHAAYRSALLVALLAICAGAWWWTSERKSASAPATAPMAERPDEAAPAGSGAPTARAARPPSAPLPPRDAPIGSIALTLQQRATTGDSLAACRLGIELLRCQRLARIQIVRPLVDERANQMEQNGDLPAAQALRQRDLDYTRLAQACADLPARLRDRGGAYLRQAALAGEPEAMLRYANGELFDPGDGYAYLASPDFDRWRREAPGMLQRALAMGRPEAAHLLHAAYASDEGMLHALVPNDALSARAYSMLVTRLQGASGPRLGGRFETAELTADERRRAVALSSQWHLQHFDGQRLDGDRTLVGIAPLHDPLASSGATGPDAMFCTPAGAPSDE